MRRIFNPRLALGRFLAGCLLVPAVTLSAQNRTEFLIKTAYANWGSQAYNLDGLGRGNGLSFRPGVVFRSGKLILGGEAEVGRYSFEPSLFQYVFYNAEDERILWQSDNVLLQPMRTNFDVTAGLAWGRRAVIFLAAKLTTVRFSQYLAVDQYRYDSSAGSWTPITDAQAEVKYRRSDSKTWLGIGCMFQLPVWYRQFTLDGTLKYYVFNQEGYNVIYGEALLSRQLSTSFTVSIGGRMEMLTSGELLGSIWSLTAGLSYRLPLNHS